MCTPFPEDSLLSGRIVSFNDGAYAAMTNENGVFEIYLPNGNYTASVVTNSFEEVSCPDDTTISFVLDGAGNTSKTDVNFSIEDVGYTDVFVSTSSTAVRINRNTVNYVYIKNRGNVEATGTLYFAADTSFTNTDTVSWSYTLSPNQGASYKVNRILPIDLTLVGQVMRSKVWIEADPSAYSELSLDDDIDEFAIAVTNSYDPNDKMVTNEALTDQTLDVDEWLSYRIRFQNTGTDTAFNVIVRDTITDYLDLRTFRMMGASHDYDLSILPGNVLQWTFADIMLPDSNVDEPGSHGYIHFDIQAKAYAYDETGESIYNDADIYFDYNPPVITNNSQMKLPDLLTSVDDDVLEEQNLVLYPNPSSGDINTDLEDGIYEVVVRNQLGVEVKRLQVSATDTIDLSSLSNGLYFVTVTKGDFIVTKSIVLSK